MSPNAILWVLAALAPLFWGTTYVVVKLGLTEVGPLWVSCLRALPAGLLLLALDPRGWRYLNLRRTLLLGTVNIALFFVLLFVAAYRLPAGIAGTLMAMGPLSMLLFLWVLRGQPPLRRQVLASLGGIVGVAILLWQPVEALDLLGVLASLSALMVITGGNLLIQRWSPPQGMLAFTGAQLVVGGLVLLPLALALEGLPPPFVTADWLALLWLDVCNTALAYLFWFLAVRRLPLASLAFLALLNPLSAIVGGQWLLGEQLDQTQWLGIGVVLACILWAQWARRSSVTSGPVR